MTDHDGRIMSKLSVQPIRATSLTLPGIMKLVDTVVWGEYELYKMPPKGERQERETNSRKRVA